jgi:hypothetical protein
MAIKKTIVWNHITISDAYIRVITPADFQNPIIILGVYANSESRAEGDQPLYYINVTISNIETHQLLFSEDALKAEGVTNRSQSYLYLKSLPEYADCEDV